MYIYIIYQAEDNRSSATMQDLQLSARKPGAESRGVSPSLRADLSFKVTEIKVTSNLLYFSVSSGCHLI